MKKLLILMVALSASSAFAGSVKSSCGIESVKLPKGAYAPKTRYVSDVVFEFITGAGGKIESVKLSAMIDSVAHSFENNTMITTDAQKVDQPVMGKLTRLMNRSVFKRILDGMHGADQYVEFSSSMESSGAVVAIAQLDRVIVTKAPQHEEFYADIIVPGGDSTQDIAFRVTCGGSY